MFDDNDPVQRFFRRYLGIATIPFSPTTIAQDPDVAAVFSSWHGLDRKELTQQALKETLEFAEQEFYRRTIEIAETAKLLHDVPEFQFNFLRVANYDSSTYRFDKRPVVFFDSELADFWFGFFFVRLCEIHTASTPNDRRQLDVVSLNQIRCIAESRRVPEDIRRSLTRYFMAHQDLAAIAASLSRVISFFVIAHEIAHVALHPVKMPDVHIRELEADDFAARILVTLRGRSDLKWASIPDGYLAAPVMFFELLNSIELVRGLPLGPRTGRAGYPSPRERRAVVLKQVANATPNDIAFCIDMRHSLSRLNVAIRLQGARNRST